MIILSRYLYVAMLFRNTGGSLSPAGIHRLCSFAFFQSLSWIYRWWCSVHVLRLSSVFGSPAYFRNGNMVLKVASLCNSASSFRRTQAVTSLTGITLRFWPCDSFACCGRRACNLSILLAKIGGRWWACVEYNLCTMNLVLRLFFFVMGWR